MPNTSLSRLRSLLLLSILMLVYLVVAADAQHGGGGGGGGHGGGGHFGGGHSGHSHSSSANSGGHHWGWLHFFSRHRSERDQSAAENMSNDTYGPLGRTRSRAHALPSNYMQTVPVHSLMSLRSERFPTYAQFRRPPRFFYGGFRRGSGCFFNGFNHVCFFEPVWPLFLSAGFGWYGFDYDFGFDYDASNTSDAFASAITTTSPEVESETPATVPTQELRGQDIDPQFFLLSLKNGTDLVVTDYWLANGYIEYVSRDGAESHIPVEALDLEETVRNNSARGLNFVLRSAP